jgi:putative endonuclease
MSVAAEESGKATRAGAWTLYLIECVDGSIYTGIAVDVAARYAAHAAGKGARYTRMHPPARLLATIAYPDHSSALKAEYQVKQLTAAAKRAFVSERPTRPSEEPSTP